MALSQIQCLDDHHVNWRVSEGKPEFFYSEDQRLALESLISSGRDAFRDYLHKTGVREFLSEPELEHITSTAEAYRPGHEHHQKPETPGPGNLTPGPGNLTPGSGEEGEDGEVSLAYWPDRSEASVAELDLGWPEASSYRGVTRVTVYKQPPTEGQTHIKEVVRKSIASAQKVIAVVMDVFTDVDIFRDLLDASYKRKIPVYIILDMAAVPCFLSMCGRADMHRGHLKNLRVRCCGGVEFFTRSAQKVRGSLSQKFLLVDGDRAISGSYSFTWSSSRLDRNLITVITGQVVETFDLQFRELYLMSRGVSLNKVPMEDEPIPDPLPQAVPAPVPASVARKFFNPKYALVSTGTHTSPTPSDQNSSNKNSNAQNPTGLKVMKGRLKEVIEEPPIHPGLLHLEKANLIPYLPTWPEPDPPSDVIGFINIRDEKRANQVHLQRSERFEVSQAIRFSSPLAQPALAKEPTSSQEEKVAQTTENVSGNTSQTTPSPTNPTDKSVEQQTPPSKDQTDSADATQQPNMSPTQENTHSPHEHTLTSPTKADSQPTDTVGQTPETQTLAPPIPKRRTLQLVIDPTPSEQSGEAQVTLVKMDQLETPNKVQIQQEPIPNRGRLTSKGYDMDSGSNEESSLDSTKVLCDRAVIEDPSSASAGSEEEFFDCSQQESDDAVVNGGQTGSGRGHRQGDGLNMMARFSQSMLDLREPSQPEDGASLIRESQHLRRQVHGSPRRLTGQLFQNSRSPVRDPRLRGPKVIINKPGRVHPPSRAAGHVIGGYRYWQGQIAPPDSAQLRVETRSGRSPRRHSPSYRKMDPESLQPPANPSGFFKMSLSKLNFRNSKAQGGGGASQKKVSVANKAVR
ncbi:protein FAM83G [Nothobranchius furzeri]|uniref:Family with sequence similarity 83 member G n=9 Tax=Nothobranchiidae TaxID=405002 RepID=A0A1A8AG26_NOTFU|nr:protein FAM83G [Nothobranchius furzeri]KAF7223518.1 protein FAM83G-like [Nothobranchius furzeri]